MYNILLLSNLTSFTHYVYFVLYYVEAAFYYNKRNVN